MQQTNPQFVCINAPGTEFHNRIVVVQEPGQPTIVQESGERGYIAFDETQLRVLCGSRMYGHNTTYWVPCIRPAHHPNACNRAFLSPDDITPTQHAAMRAPASALTASFSKNPPSTRKERPKWTGARI